MLEDRRVLSGFLCAPPPDDFYPCVNVPIPDQTAIPTLDFQYTLQSNFRTQFFGETLTYSADFIQVDDDGTPSNWLRFSPSTETFSGSPSFADIGHVDVTVTATDSGFNSVTDTFTITVPGGNHAPVVVHWVPAPQAYVDEPYNFQLPADAFVDVDGDSITYSATGLPAWLTFNDPTLPPNTFSGTPEEADLVSSPFSITVIATDTHLATASVRLAAPSLPGTWPTCL
jgi:hypothetical protein